MMFVPSLLVPSTRWNSSQKNMKVLLKVVCVGFGIAKPPLGIIGSPQSMTETVRYIPANDQITDSLQSMSEIVDTF